jgi:peptide/nickel transport system substrate-binding protein
MSPQTPTSWVRRAWSTATILLLAALILSPSGNSLAQRLPPTANRAQAQTYHEAPALAAMVQAGTLPPVSQRLPDNPPVVPTVTSIGSYGGTWHAMELGWEPGVFMTIYESLIRWKADYSGYEPSLAETYEWSPDGKTFTMHLRQNVRWSDGAVFSSDDIRFWWEDFAKNGSVNWGAGIPYYLFKADHQTPIDMTFPDANTVIWASDQPLWLAPYNLAQISEFSSYMMKPRHYLAQFHPTYTPSATYDDLRLKL